MARISDNPSVESYFVNTLVGITIAAVLLVVFLHLRDRGRIGLRRATAKDVIGGVLIVSAWAYGVVPNYLNVANSQRTASITYKAQAITGLGQTMGQLFLISTALCAFALIVMTIRDKGPARHAGLVLLIAPFVALTASGILAGGGYTIYVLIYPLAILALWRAQLPLQSLSLIGWLTLALAVFSLVLGYTNPEVGTTDAPIVGDKVAWSSLLAGPHSHPNVLGLALAAGLPFMWLVRFNTVKWAGIPLLAWAIVWSGNRNSILAAGVVLVAWLILRRTKSVRWLAVPAAIGAGLVFLTPLTSEDASDYSYRGQIWSGTFRLWEANPWLGGGPRFFQLTAQYRSELGQTAFSGHNAFVHTLATGGLITVALVTVLMIYAFKRSMNLAGDRTIPLLFLLGVVFNSWLQNPAVLSSVDVMSYTYWVPLAVILFLPTRQESDSDESRGVDAGSHPLMSKR